MSTAARILVVEDEWLLAEDHAFLLRKAGFEVVGPAASVRDALQLIDAQKVDLALLDIGLAEETSFPIAKRLDALGIPFVFLSGHFGEDHPSHFPHRQILSKPAAPDEMIAALRALAAAQSS